MRHHYFISGIGTGIGKTLVSAILAEALDASYWKPVQAGTDDLTDSEKVTALIQNGKHRVWPETYRLRMAASPHIAAGAEGVRIDLGKIESQYQSMNQGRNALLIEGAGGLLVPLNEREFVSHLIIQLGCPLILVSRNYLGSINHSLLASQYCREKNIPVAGWVFCDQYLDYEEEIVEWSGYPRLASIRSLKEISPPVVRELAESVSETLRKRLANDKS